MFGSTICGLFQPAEQMLTVNAATIVQSPELVDAVLGFVE